LHFKIDVALNTNQSYKLPHAVDREHQDISYVVKEINKKSLPGFIKFNESIRTLTFEPNSKDIPNKYALQIDLVDSFGVESSYFINILLHGFDLF
jgi:hypothetical protein